MVCLVSRAGRQLQRYNMGRHQVVGCIPYRLKRGGGSLSNNELEVEVLVISSKKGQGLMFPKGGWELDESVEEAALRESLEEAGVCGNVERGLGKWNFRSKRHGSTYEGFMFPLKVKEELDSWPEEHFRRRIWMTVEEAREVCQHWWMKEALDIFFQRLKPELSCLREEEPVAVHPCSLNEVEAAVETTNCFAWKLLTPRDS